MFVSLLPFSTSVLNAFPRALIAPFLFGANLALVGWLLFFQWAYAGAQPGMLAPFVTAEYRAGVNLRMLAVPVAMTLTAFICFWSAGISVAIYLLLLPLYMLPGKFDSRTSFGAAPDSSPGSRPDILSKQKNEKILAGNKTPCAASVTPGAT
jgi:hypothetical protein